MAARDLRAAGIPPILSTHSRPMQRHLHEAIFDDGRVEARLRLDRHLARRSHGLWPGWRKRPPGVGGQSAVCTTLVYRRQAARRSGRDVHYEPATTPSTHFPPPTPPAPLLPLLLSRSSERALWDSLPAPQCALRHSSAPSRDPASAQQWPSPGRRPAGRWRPPARRQPRPQPAAPVAKGIWASPARRRTRRRPAARAARERCPAHVVALASMGHLGQAQGRHSFRPPTPHTTPARSPASTGK